MDAKTDQTIEKNCIEYFGGDELAASVIINKYLLKDSAGNFIEKHPDELVRRLTKEFVRIEKKYANSLSEEEIYTALDHFRYVVPQGSPLFGIGNDHQTISLANCFVVDSPVDSYGGILKQDQELAQIMKRRGGVGIDLSTIRPHGTTVNNAARTSDGISCFMERYSNTTKEVAQGGRRGALLQALSCKHVDIEKFIDAKKDLTKVTGANISVKWDDEFLHCVEKNKEFILRYPVEAEPNKAQLTKKVLAKDIWKKFVENAHASAEPGCLFWDTIVKNSISDCYKEDGFASICVNPCSELVLSSYNSCVLLVINLSNFVKEQFTKKECLYNLRRSMSY